MVKNKSEEAGNRPYKNLALIQRIINARGLRMIKQCNHAVTNLPLGTSVRGERALHRNFLQELLGHEAPHGPHGLLAGRADSDLGLALVAKDVTRAALENRGALGDLQTDGALQELLQVSDGHAGV